MLSLGEAPAISSEKFLESIGERLLAAEAAELRNLSLSPGDDVSGIDSIQGWNTWETSMRNAILRMRVKGASALLERYERDGGGFLMDTEAAARAAFSKSDPLEREKLLDEARWAFCDDLELGHEFDIVKLAAYRLKLLLCEKRLILSVEKGGENYDAVVDSVYDREAAAE